MLADCLGSDPSGDKTGKGRKEIKVDFMNSYLWGQLWLSPPGLSEKHALELCPKD